MAQYPIRDYIHYFSRKRYPALFDDEALNRLQNVRRAFGDQVSEEVILEVRLSDHSKTCDYSFRVDTGKKPVKEYWLELDSDACAAADIAPCYFIDASALKPDQEAVGFYETALPALRSSELQTEGPDLHGLPLLPHLSHVAPLLI